MVPVVVQPVTRPEALVPGAGVFQPPLLLSPRPPLIDDFDDDRLAVDVDVRAMYKALRVTIEPFYVPRLI